MVRSKAFDEIETAEHTAGVSGVHEAPTDPAPYVEEPTFDDNLLGSIPLDALGVDFQPIVDLLGGQTVAFEALPRCRVEGLRDLAELYARANFEKTLGELGRTLRELASRECMGTPLYLRVHPGELKYGNLVRPDDPVANHDAPVFLQLAQSTFSTVAIQVVRELAGRSGVSLVLDNFSAGPSTLKQLIELEPAVVKIDRELIAGVDRSSRKRAVVSAIAELCADLDILAIAKGVDCEPELDAVEACGIQLAQGYVLGEPAPLPTISVWPPG